MDTIDFPRLFVSLALVIGLIWLTAYIMKRTGMDKKIGGLRGTAQGRLQIVDAMYVDSRRKLMLVRADQTEYLLLLNGDHTTLLATLAGKD